MKSLIDEIERFSRVKKINLERGLYEPDGLTEVKASYLITLCDRLKAALEFIEELRGLVYMVNELQEDTSLTEDEWNDFVAQIMDKARDLLERKLPWEVKE